MSALDSRARGWKKRYLPGSSRASRRSNSSSGGLLGRVGGDGIEQRIVLAELGRGEAIGRTHAVKFQRQSDQGQIQIRRLLQDAERGGLLGGDHLIDRLHRCGGATGLLEPPQPI